MRKILSLTLMLLMSIILFTACKDTRTYSAKVDTTDVAKLTLFTYDGKGESMYGLLNLGHTFLSVENTSDTSINIGKKELNIGKTLTLGTWSIQSHFGVWYNVENNYIKEHNKYDGRVSVTIGISSEDIDLINEFIEDNDHWGPIKNCSYFALNLYNTVASDTEFIDTPLIYTPSYISSIIKKFDTCEFNREIPVEDKMSYFDGTSLVEYTLSERGIQYEGV